MAQVFLTGGSGFIGRALIRRLKADGHDVRALVRSDASAATVTALGAEAVRGELTDPTTWQDAVAGSAVLFHLAAETGIFADPSRQFEITVGGTRAALQAARGQGVPHFVNCSSEAVLLAGDPLVDIDESAPLRPDSPAAYSATKAQAEALVTEANAPGFTTVSIRPRFVWGAGSAVTDGFRAAATAGQFAWVAGGRHTTDVTYVDNAVEGLVLGWQRGRGGQAYFVTDQEPVVFRDFMETVFGFYGADADIPELDAQTAAAAVPVPVLWFIGQTCTLRTDKAVSELGYRPVITRAAALEELRRSLQPAERVDEIMR